MAVPDRIERTLELDHPQEKVWAALATADGLSGWFGDKAELDELRAGGEIRVCWNGVWSSLRIEVVEPPRLLAYTWPMEGLPPDDPRRTYVEIALEPVASRTRLRVVETGFDQAPDETAREGNVAGWQLELAKLVRYLDDRS